MMNATVITTSRSVKKNSYHNEYKKLNINVCEMEYSKIGSVIKGIKTIQKLIDNNDIHVVQSYGFRAEYILSRLKRVKKVTTIRNRPLFNYRIIYGYLFGTILCYLHIMFIKNMDGIIACSKTVAKSVKPFKMNPRIIFNAIDFSYIRSSVEQVKKSSVRKTLRLSTKKSVFLTIASKLPGKNIEFLINAFNHKAELKHDLLIVAGYVDKSVIKKYSSCCNIYFAGKIQNINQYFQASDYFISASLSEGMPNAVLEAMAFGLPVLLSDIEAHIEIFNIVNMQIGKIFNNNNYFDLVRKMCELKKADYNSLSRNSRICAKKHFSAEKMSKHYQNIYKELVQ